MREITRETRRPARSPDQRRRWCLPTAMLAHAGERMEGEQILAERPDTFGLLLWRTVRDVTLWAQTPPERRAHLFGAGTGEHRAALLRESVVPPAAAPDLDTLADLLTRPDAGSGDTAARCCLALSAWAAAERCPETALHFAQAAALASPLDPVASLETGRRALACGQPVRAETWLRRCVALGRRSAAWDPYAHGLLSLGELYRERGQSARAVSHYRLSFRAARRFKVQGPRTRAGYGLLLIALAAGDTAEACRVSRKVARLKEWKRADPAGLADVLIGFARFWMGQGWTAPARHALHRLEPIRAALPAARHLVAAALHAEVLAAKSASAERALRAWDEAVCLVGDEEVPADTSLDGSVHLLRAAARLGDASRVARAYRLALRWAPREDFARVRDAADGLARKWLPNLSVSSIGA